VLPLLGPWFIHPALDAADSAGRLGLAADETYALSDQSVLELVLARGEFAFEGPDGMPFYDADERAHMRDARLLLGFCLAAGGVSLLKGTAELPAQIGLHLIFDNLRRQTAAE